MAGVYIDLEDARLEGVLTGNEKEKAVVITHPHPLYGGNMDNDVVTTIEKAFRLKGFASLRFNFRGTGGSTGEFDDGKGEVRDVTAAVNWVKQQGIGHVILAGYSFGSRINAQAITSGLEVMDHVMVSPPVAFMTFDPIVSLENTGLIITGENDDIAPPDQITSHIRRWHMDTDFKVIPGCDHFYSGGLGLLETHIDEYLEKGGNLMSGFDYDYVVIGSGFGGSVSALRLSEKGYKVAVLEMGKEWSSDDFPRTNWNIRKFLWFPWLRCFGYQMLTFFRHVYILHGGGVGGGSLVYANQLLTPPDKVFQRPEWGEGDWKDKLKCHYDTAKKMLGANPSPQVGIADRYLREVGKEMRGRDTFHKNDVGIFFGSPDQTVSDPYFDGKGPDRTGCTFCGACMVGCRVGAKNTLDKNYLYLARGLGAKVFPETRATAVKKVGGGYQVETRKTGNRFTQKKIWRTKGVIFSAGVLGTVKLLHECRSKGYLPDISDHLGRYVRTNSEVLLGVRSRNRDIDWNDQIAITSGVHVDDTTHIEMVRYNRGSDVLLNLLTLMTDGGGKIPRALKYLGNIVKNPILFLKLLWPLGKASSTSVLLVMQTDENHLELNYKPGWWRFGKKGLTSELPKGHTRSPAYIPVANDVAKRLSKKMDGDALSSFPEVLLNCSTTAHILGGCCMGDSADQGVVDREGQVFNYPGLHVADGSVISANLGVNPSLTITALSEYIMSNIPDKK